jgi:hypothetical protein
MSAVASEFDLVFACVSAQLAAVLLAGSNHALTRRMLAFSGFGAHL